VGTSPPLTSAQTSPATFPLAGDWDGILVGQGPVGHVVLHMSTTPEGKMTALLDDIDRKFQVLPQSEVLSTAVVWFFDSRMVAEKQRRS